MTFQLTSAPADADFVGYRNDHGWVIVQRRSDGIWETCANTNTTGCNLIVAGISASHKSFWSHEAQQFLCGTVHQLTRTDWETGA